MVETVLEVKIQVKEHNLMVVPVHKHRKIWYTLIFCVVSFLCGCSSKNWEKEAIEESKQIGNEIIAALEKYKDDTGAYPKKLSLLVPDYIDEIKPPVAGEKKWIYWGPSTSDKDKGLKYSLSFQKSPTSTVWFYDSVDPGWYRDTR